MILIKNCNLYTPKSVGHKDILIGGGKILHIADEISCDLECVDEIDAAGEIVHPGFIDGHVHVLGGGGEDGMLSRVPPLSEKKVAAAGVTTLVGLLGTDGYTRTIRDLVAKVQGFNEWGLSAYCLTGSYQIPTVTLTGSVADDIIWIKEVIGVKVAVSDHRCSFPTTDELLRLASEVRLASLMSHKVGLVHIHVGADPRAIEQLFEIHDKCPIPLKHFYPTHMEGHMDMARRWLDIGGHIDLTCHGDTDKKAIDLLERYPDSVTLSTDSNGSFPKWNKDKSAIVGMGAGSISELNRFVQRMIDSGFDRSLAYKAVTENPATAMKLKHKGRIAHDMDADIVIRDGDDIRYVISKGEILVREGIAKDSMYENV